MKANRQRRISATFLLAVILSMQYAISFHHHEYIAPQVETCSDCQHHVHHAGHFTAQAVHLHDCLLCQLHTLPAVLPSEVQAKVVCTTIDKAYTCDIVAWVNAISGVSSPRAPPCI